MKNALKKFLGAIALGTATLGLVSCGGGGSSSETDKEGNKIVKIMFHVDARSAEGQAYKKRIEAFNTEYKDKKIKASASYVARSTGVGNYETDLTNKLVDGTLADIITFDAPNCASYAKNGILYDITKLVPSDVTDDFISKSMYNGKLYGLPIQESSAGFYYNKKIFSEAGVDVSKFTVDNPWTFDEFKGVCEKLKEKLGKNRAVDMRLDSHKDETATYLLYPFIYAAGGSFVSEDGNTATGYFDSAASKKGFQFLKDLMNSEYTSQSIGATDFFDGKIGMYLSSGWTIPDLDNKYPTTFPNRDSWGILPYPKDVTTASATGSWCFGITNNRTKDKEPVKELLLWLTSKESSKDITTATGMIPARKSVAEYKEGTPEYVLYNQLLKTGKARPDTVAYPKLTSGFQTIIGQIGTKEVSELVDAAAKDLQQELNNLNK